MRFGIEYMEIWGSCHTKHGELMIGLADKYVWGIKVEF